MSKKKNSVQVVLALPKPVLQILSMTKAIEGSIAAASKTFPSPNPPLATFSADIDALDAAETATKARTKGSVPARDAKLVILRSDCGLLRAYVQQVADADPANAATIAHAAGMAVKKPSSHVKAPLAAKPSTTVSGLISVSAKTTAPRQANDWEYSTDGGKTWVSAPSTLQAKTTISGLQSGVLVYVRHRPVTKTGAEMWSDPITVLVH